MIPAGSADDPVAGFVPPQRKHITATFDLPLKRQSKPHCQTSSTLGSNVRTAIEDTLFLPVAQPRMERPPQGVVLFHGHAPPLPLPRTSRRRIPRDSVRINGNHSEKSQKSQSESEPSCPGSDREAIRVVRPVHIIGDPAGTSTSVP